MFGNVPRKRNFSYTTTKSLKKQNDASILQKMKFSSFSSVERRPSKRRLIFLVILLFVVIAFIAYHGFRTSGIEEININETEIERINGE